MRKIMLAIMMTALLAVSVFAQATGGRLVGTVAGADGAVVPGATVVLTDKQTGKERTSTTNGEGGFLFSLLDVGSYTVKVEAKGFKVSNTTVTIQVGQEYSLPVSLEVGQVSESVTVTAGADVVNSSNAELSSTLNNRQITELPLVSRDPVSLIRTQLGSASNANQGTSINGSRTSSTSISRDGINIQDNFIRSNATDFAPGRPSVDNVEEFTLTSQASVDTGFGGAQVNFVTPRGGNEFHGAVWNYNRNSKFSANNWFSNAGGNYAANDPVVLAGFRKAGEERQPRTFRNRNQYGFKVKGPILKNKIFFFVYGEILKDIVQTSKLTTVLTPTAKAGIFRYAGGGSVFGTSIFGPGVVTGPGLPAPTGINSVSNTLFLANLPTGNSFEVGDGLNTTGYRFLQKNNTDRNSLTSRVDYDINEKNNVSVVVDYNLEKNLRADVDNSFNTTPVVLQPSRNVTWSAGWRFSPTATLSNEFRIGKFFSSPDFFRTDKLPNAYFTPTLITNPNVTFQQQGRAVETRNLQDTANWQVGDHSLRFGGQFQSVRIRAYNDAGIIPTYTIGLGTAGPNISAAAIATNAGGPALTAPQLATAQGLLALLGGTVSAGTQTFNATSQTSGYVQNATSLRVLKYNAYSPYIADSWRTTSELTLNFGVRYDYYSPLKSENGLYFEPKLGQGQTIVQAILDPAGTYQFIGGNAGKANTFYKADKNNVAVSASFAYAPRSVENRFLKWITGGSDNSFVIRGGFRTSYVNDELVRAPDNANSGNAGLSTSVSALNGGAAQLNDRLGTPFTSTLTTPTFLGSRSYINNNTTSFASFGTVFAVNPNLQAPRQNEYQVGIQRKIGDFAFEARYVGGFSKNVLRTIDYNQIKLTSGWLADFNTARSNIVAGCTTQTACQAGTTIIPTFNSLLTNATIRNLFVTGQAVEVINVYLQNGLIPNANVSPLPAGDLRSQFLANPNTGVANVLENGGKYYYNSGQFELRRNIKNGLGMQVNYTFSKELTDAIGTAQTRVEPFLDNNNPSLDYARADYDQTHVINVNATYELPFGKNRKWLNSNKWLDYAVGGWQFGMIWRIASGSPITFTDARGTLNRTGRSARQTALTNLTSKDLKKLVGTFRTPCGIFFVNPTAININQSNLSSGNCNALNTGVPTGTVGGAASSGFAQPQFAGQIFTNNGPGQTSGLRRAVVDGPWSANADISMLKNFRITEKTKFQIRGELFNLTNTPFFAPGQFLDINSTSFGRITGTSNGSRVVQFAGRFEF
jgi:Carboxypeptidase regulatory-like domain